MLLILTSVALLVPAFAGFDSAPAPRTESPAAPTVRVPSYPNSTCPIMGKPISTKLYTDTGRGRIWVCCKGCIADIHEDEALAYTTAYPSERTVAAETCPVTGKALRADSPWVALQGLRFRVFDAAAAQLAVAESQPVLARVVEPTLVDVLNARCPIDDKPVDPQAFVVIDGKLVRLSTQKHVDAAKAAPAQTLERARTAGPRLR
jgi:hypothetical protein